MKKYLVGLMMLLAVWAYAAPTTTINVPNNFTPNTTIQSSQVNADFNECQTQYNNHSHTDITQVGSITSGAWLGTPVATTYGGTGNNWGAVAQGSVPVFNGAGTMTTITGTTGQALVSNGVGSTPSFTTVGGANDSITRGLELNYAGTGDVIASAGVVYIGSSVINSATSFTMNLSTATNWASGTVVSYVGVPAASCWCYVGVNAGGRVRLLGRTAPNITDVNGNLQGTKYYIEIPDADSSGDYWRVIGAFRTTAANPPLVEQSWYQSGNYVAYDVPVDLTAVVSDATWSALPLCTTYIPKISTLGKFFVFSQQIANTCGIALRPTNSTGAADRDGFGTNSVSCVTDCITSTSQSVDYQNDAGDTATQISLKGYYLNIR